jgi:ABC-2 type transport system permease protein
VRLALPSGAFARRTLSLARAEVLHVTRDRATLVQIVIVPLIQLLLLSNAATFAIERTPAYVVDFDRTSTSRGLVRHLTSSGLIDVVGQSASPDAANEAMLTGRATLVVVVPHDFESSLVRTGTAPVALDLNAEKGSAAGIVQSYVVQTLDAYARELAVDIRPTQRAALARPAAFDPSPPVPGADVIDVRTRGWYNPGLDYTAYMVPGILVALVTMIGTLLTAQNIAREKEIGTLEQLNVTPISRAEFVTAKLLPFWVLALLDLALGLAVSRLVFGIPVRGSLLLLFASAGVYLVSALAIGLLVSTVVETQQQAMFISFFLIMVYLLMSGLLTPIDSMPQWMQLASELNPVRHFVAISRAVLVKGAGLSEIRVPLAVLIVYAAVAMTVAIRQYRKRSA